MTSLRTITCALAALALLAGARAEGQSLSISPASTTFPTAGVTQLNAGGVEDTGTTVTVDPGGPLTSWTLRLRAGSSTLNAAGKPIGDLFWRLDGSSTWTALGTTDQTIKTGMGSATVKVYLRATLRWSMDGPGNYGADLTYSMTTS